MTLKGIITEFENRIQAIEKRQRELLDKFEEIKLRIREYIELKEKEESK